MEIYKVLLCNDVLLVSVIIFSVIYILRWILREFWNNGIFQRFVILIPFVVGILISLFWNYNCAGIDISILSKIALGCLSAMISSVGYKFIKDLSGGADFYEMLKNHKNNNHTENQAQINNQGNQDNQGNQGNPDSLNQTTNPETKSDINQDNKGV